MSDHTAAGSADTQQPPRGSLNVDEGSGRVNVREIPRDQDSAGITGFKDGRWMRATELSSFQKLKRQEADLPQCSMALLALGLSFVKPIWVSRLQDCEMTERQTDKWTAVSLLACGGWLQQQQEVSLATAGPGLLQAQLSSTRKCHLAPLDFSLISGQGWRSGVSLQAGFSGPCLP